MNNSTLWAWISENTYSALLIYMNLEGEKIERARTRNALELSLVFFPLNNLRSHNLTSKRYSVIFWKIDSSLDLWHFFEQSCMNVDEIWHEDSLKMLRRLGRGPTLKAWFFLTGPGLWLKTDGFGIMMGEKGQKDRMLNLLSSDWSTQGSNHTGECCVHYLLHLSLILNFISG